ncbi:hypothetical protein [Stenotrophomonas sp. NPDC077461]|uniref:ORC-CDC6 family AAA ATPase n=1 Tax=Stenotrophomonas sp. NPDC077461 TaxID=3414698 RepID=UPI003C30CEE0
MAVLREKRIRACAKNLANNIRAENISYSSYLDLYSGVENVENIDNINNTVIYGRRGSGKTHLLRALKERILERIDNDRNLPVYIDLRRIIPVLSSDSQDPDVDSILIFKHVVQDVAYECASAIPRLFDINEFDEKNTQILNSKRVKVEEGIKKIYLEFDGREYTKPRKLRVSVGEVQSLGLEAKLGRSPSLSATGKGEKSRQQDVSQDKYISVLEVSNEIDRLIDNLDLNRITILLDEWSEIALPTQLMLAELIKKNFSAISVSVKIAAIPNRTNLGIKTEKKFVGLEDGGDISSYPLDMRYVFEVNRAQTRDFFNDLLLRHLRAIDENAVKDILADSKKSDASLINIFFANVALNEILIACAGVPRDFMNLFLNSYDKFLLSGSSSSRISVKDLRSANLEWYESDKKEQVDKHPVERQLLEAIVHEIVGVKKSMHFLLPEKYAQNKHIQNLIDFRVMHLRRSGYSHKDHAGVVYNVYSIDYGCHNSLNIQKSKLDSSVLEGLSVKDLRDIRRISLEDKFFSQFLLSVGEAFPCPSCNRPIDTNHLAYVKQGLCNHCFDKVEKAA